MPPQIPDPGLFALDGPVSTLAEWDDQKNVLAWVQGTGRVRIPVTDLRQYQRKPRTLLAEVTLAGGETNVSFISTIPVDEIWDFKQIMLIHDDAIGTRTFLASVRYDVGFPLSQIALGSKTVQNGNTPMDLIGLSAMLDDHEFAQQKPVYGYPGGILTIINSNALQAGTKVTVQVIYEIDPKPLTFNHGTPLVGSAT